MSSNPFARKTPPGASFRPLAPQGGPAAAVAAAQPANVTSDGEAFNVVIPSWAPVGEVVIYRTVKQWRAIDVFLSPRVEVLPNAQFTVRVYAVLRGGLRVLIASGRFGKFDPLSGALGKVPFGPEWVVACRAQPSLFEVTLEYTQISFAPATGIVELALSASNDAVVAPSWVGVMPCEVDVGATVFTSTPTRTIPDPELVRVSGAPDETVATPRYLHIHRNRVGVVMGGLVPLISLPLGMGTAGGGGSWDISLRGKTFGVIGSSTASITTVANDVAIQAFVR